MDHQPPTPPSFCSACGTAVTGKFCGHCGAPTTASASDPSPLGAASDQHRFHADEKPTFTDEDNEHPRREHAMTNVGAQWSWQDYSGLTKGPAPSDWSTHDQWSVWQRYGREDKVFQGLRDLCYDGAHDGYLYYHNIYDGERFYIRTSERVEYEHSCWECYHWWCDHVEQKRSELIARSGRPWKIGLWVGLSILAIIVAVVVMAATEESQAAPLAVLGFLGLISAPFAWFAYKGSILRQNPLPDPPAFPPEKVFYSTVERREMEEARQDAIEDRRRHEANRSFGMQVAQSVLLFDMDRHLRHPR
jgi:hypothetical protein